MWSNADYKDSKESIWNRTAYSFSPHFKKIPAVRKSKCFSLDDMLMSVLAMFTLKIDSLLQFDKSRETNEGNILKKIFSQVQRQKAHKQFLYEIPKPENYFLLNIDGTGFFASSKIKCPHCLTRSLTKNEVELLESEEDPQDHSFHHQLLGAAIAHPDVKQVIPLCPEPILIQNGESKNGCEKKLPRGLSSAFEMITLE